VPFPSDRPSIPTPSFVLATQNDLCQCSTVPGFWLRSGNGHDLPLAELLDFWRGQCALLEVEDAPPRALAFGFSQASHRLDTCAPRKHCFHSAS